MAVGTLRCIECSGFFEKLYEDPRVPPLDEYNCLCPGCLDCACDERIEELEEDILEITKIKEAI